MSSIHLPNIIPKEQDKIIEKEEGMIILSD